MKLTKEAEQDLDNQEDYNRKKLAQEIKKRLENERDRENISYINKSEFGIEFHRLKLAEDGFDHRIYFDYMNSELTVFAVRHRDHAYTEKDLKEVRKRLGNM